MPAARKVEPPPADAPEISTITNTKSNESIMCGGYVYTANHTTMKNGVSSWRCGCRKSLGCPARLYTRILDGARVINGELPQHKESCKPDPDERIRDTVRSSVRKQAFESKDKIASVIADAVNKIEPAYHPILPDQKNLQKMGLHQRSRANKINQGITAEANFKSLAELHIPPSMVKMPREPPHDETILLYDSMDSDPIAERILVFGTKRHLELLREAKVISADGRFCRLRSCLRRRTVSTLTTVVSIFLQ